MLPGKRPRNRVAPTSGNEPMNTSGIANWLVSDATQCAPFTESPAPPPGSDSQAVTCRSSARTMSSVTAWSAWGRFRVARPSLPRSSKRMSPSTARSVRAGRDPGLDLGPGALGCPTARHHADVAARDAELELVRAPHLLHQQRRL